MNADWILSVEQLNEYARRLLAGDPLLRAVRVRGEISGFKRHYSGHLYFSIKDDKARVNCVMFRQHALRLDVEPRDGMKVVVSGAASLYPQTGGFQLYCEHLQREGAGEMYLRFEQLKQKLSEEGLFDPARKRPLPALPRRVGIVTSPAGAVVRDMLRVARRRFPGVPILICPAAVQGEGAAQDIARALNLIDEKGGVDVILCGRGGGSMEDLWAFNEEVVARAIARARVPVVSCVGHETDFTIADFVADVRAGTPSMAAELAIPVRAELERLLDGCKARMARAQGARLDLARSRLGRVQDKLADPVRALIAPRRAQMDGRVQRLARGMAARAEKERGRVEALARALEALSPRRVMERGYAVVTDVSGVVGQIGALTPGGQVDIRMRDGRAAAQILSIRREAEYGGQEKDGV